MKVMYKVVYYDNLLSCYLYNLPFQMELKRVKAEKEKAELEKQEMKLEREIAGYDPWGREGGGAPVRNQKGQVVGEWWSFHSASVTLLNH